MKKLVCDNARLNAWLHNIMRSMAMDNWRPDYIVGITRGGLIPATMLSHYMNIKLHTLNVSLRDGKDEPESNLWMAEDAFGYAGPDSIIKFDTAIAKKILIVDDINDTGATLNWIKQDWPSGCLPNNNQWNYVWNNNVRFAVMVNNEASEFKNVDYVGEFINKAENDVWVEFPWERWWQ